MFVSPSGIGGSLIPHFVRPAIAARMILPNDLLLMAVAEKVTQAVGAGYMDAFDGGCKGFCIKFLKAKHISGCLQQDAFGNLLAGAVFLAFGIEGGANPYRLGIGCTCRGNFPAVIAAALIAAENTAEGVTLGCVPIGVVMRNAYRCRLCSRFSVSGRTATRK